MLWLSLLAQSPCSDPKVPPQKLGTSPALPWDDSQEGRWGTPMQDYTSEALGCLRMQPASPWQLGMLPSPGPTGADPLPSNVVLTEDEDRASPSTQPSLPHPQSPI